MRDQKEVSPPGWAQRILAWYCKPELLEDLDGDLTECFRRNVESKGLFRARVIFVADVIKFLRLYTIRKPQFIDILIYRIMIGSYLKTSVRNLLRNRLFSFINIFGLSVSMTVGLLMIAMISDLESYDKFHQNGDRIFRLANSHRQAGQSEPGFYATTSFKAARMVSESVPGIEAIALMRRGIDGDVTADQVTIPLRGFYANDAFFNVFSFELSQGNPKTALKEPFSLVLTEKSALKLFGDKSALGRIVVLDQNREFTVTGIVRDLPVFSHIKFDMLASHSTCDVVFTNTNWQTDWTNMWDTWAYALIKEDADPVVMQHNLDRISQQENKANDQKVIEIMMRPLQGIMTGESLNNEIGLVVGGTVVKVFSILTLIVIASACFNYTNLSIARTLKRSREVGIRKTIGALKGHIALQFTVESVLISLLALLAAICFFVFLRPHFIGIERSLSELLVLKISPALLVMFVAFAILTGVIAGLFPALYFARLNAIKVLKNIAPLGRMKAFTLRKGLIVFQYVISIVAICVTIILHHQYNHFLAFDLGFNTANVVNIKLHGNKAEILKQEIGQLPEVTAISGSAMIQSLGSYWMTTAKNPATPEDSVAVFYNVVDDKYLDLHEYKLLAGETFKPVPEGADESVVIVNENVLKVFDISPNDPQGAIGKTIVVNRKPLTIIGVTRNFHYGRADSDQNGKPVMMRYGTESLHYLNVKILSNDWPATYERLEKIWKKTDPVHPFEARFYSEEIANSFNGLKASTKVGGFLAFLVICIASIGLFGMVVFTAETRLKEISIRKVLGASESNLLYQLSKGFLILLLLAAFIGIPLAYFGVTHLILVHVGNHAPVTLTQLIVGVSLVFVIAFLMIVAHTLKVARANPAEVLKTE